MDSKQFASAGSASERSGNAVNPIGVYINPDGVKLGVIDPIQGDACIRQGFTLDKEYNTVAEVIEAAKEVPEATKPTIGRPPLTSNEG